MLMMSEEVVAFNFPVDFFFAGLERLKDPGLD
jgi:hypothetical protein